MRPSYEEVLAVGVLKTERFAERLFDLSAQMALLKAWSQWNADQTAGTVVEISADTLLRCRDEKVVSLMKLCIAAHQTLEVLRAPAKPILKVVRSGAPE